MAASRIASLLATATEIVAALGFRDAMVARSHECDYPGDVRALPAVTETKIRLDAPSAAIDKDVKALIEHGLSVYKVDAHRLRALAPDVIVTQTQCEVCAVGPKDLLEALAHWTGRRPAVISLAPNALADVWADIRRVAAALGTPERGDRLVETLSQRMADIAARAAVLDHRPSVACIEWIDPLMAAGNWMPELVDMAGGRNLFGEAGKHSPWLTWEAIVAADPEVILVLPCGFDIPRTRAEMGPLLARPEWRDLKAAREGRVHLMDGNQFFNRPGPRLAESLEILAEILHPDAFRFGHEGRGWVRLARPRTSG
ncbi:MAG: cobalamin-binding protein [Alphaproteobacteria bacterium]|nr:cobalamin-binding protein [Alphaproteobacteria bacterium]